MEAAFPGEVEVRYYDALAPDVRAEHDEAIRDFSAHHWPYPVALVNGEVVSVGSVSSFAIYEQVDSIRRAVPARRG